ncbi:MAG: tetratricopeptide repeat protein [Deltaproteobacteria bacterium]|nr:tetratricopeptide repeat protein [Deltaproteobacteria bacterium]
MYGSGLNLFYAGQYAMARDKFLAVAKDFPDAPEVRDAVYKLGEAFYREENWGEAGAYFRLYIDRYPLTHNARDAKARLAQCEERAGGPIEAARLPSRVSPVVHRAVLADFLPFPSETALRRASAQLVGQGVTTVIAAAATRPRTPVHALLGDARERQGAYFPTDRAPVVGDVIEPLCRVAGGLKLRVFALIDPLDASWAEESGGDARLDLFDPEVRARAQGLIADLAKTPVAGIVVAGLNSPPSGEASEHALAAYEKIAGRRPAPEAFFDETGAPTAAYAEFAEFKARAAAELAAALAGAAKETNASLRVFVEVDARALTDAPDALAALAQDAEALLNAPGVDGLLARVPWHKDGIADTAVLEKSAREAHALDPSGERIVLALPVFDEATKRFYLPDEIRAAYAALTGRGPRGVAVFPARLDFPYNSLFTDAPVVQGKDLAP